MPSAVTVQCYEAFSSIAGKGNPAGVVLDAEGLSDAQMQQIAAHQGYNETAFVCRSASADLGLRYFTPGHEMDLCGHGTVAALAALAEASRGTVVRTIETKAGVLAVEVEWVGGRPHVMLCQAQARFEPFEGDRAELAHSLGVSVHDLDPRWGPVYGSTGVWTLLVPMRSREVFQNMVPQNSRFPGILTGFPRASVHPFCFDTLHPEASIHARHFSSPYSGTIEDPVTGTASGVLGAWWLANKTAAPEVRLWVEQGIEVGRDGLVEVHARRSGNAIEVSIAGTAVKVSGETAPRTERRQKPPQ